MSKYLYLEKMRILTTLAYRFEVFTSLGANVIIMFAVISLWKTAYQGVDTVGGVNETQMVTYAVMAIILSSILRFGVEDVINSRVHQGDIAMDLIRPINLMVAYLFEDIGTAVSSLVNHAFVLLWKKAGKNVLVQGG